jgi:hypothetical protein
MYHISSGLAGRGLASVLSSIVTFDFLAILCLVGLHVVSPTQAMIAAILKRT